MTLTKRLEGLTPAMIARLPVMSRVAFDVAFTIAKWQMRSATRKSLGKLDRHLLCDIRLEPGKAQDEINKPFWQD